MNSISGHACYHKSTAAMPPPQRVGPPRVGKQNKLIHRFYEAFFLLCIFIQTQATHVTIIQPPHDAQTYRRRFLRNLAYVCDYTKGGSTTTAIGLAAQNDGYTFWLASNTKPKAKVMQFVGDVLELLKGLWNSKDQGDEDVERMLTERCVKFAAGRIKKEVALLLNGIEDYKECLERSKGAVGMYNMFVFLIENSWILICHRYAIPRLAGRVQVIAQPHGNVFPRIQPETPPSSSRTRSAIANSHCTISAGRRYPCQAQHHPPLHRTSGTSHPRCQRAHSRLPFYPTSFG